MQFDIACFRPEECLVLVCDVSFTENDIHNFDLVIRQMSTVSLFRLALMPFHLDY